MCAVEAIFPSSLRRGGRDIMQWFFESGATPFVRAAQSGDVELMQLLMKHGAI